MCEQCRTIAENQGLKLEQKTGWKQGELGEESIFVHCTMRDPDQIRASGGLDPTKSAEWVVPAEDGHGDWRWNRFVFAFMYNESNLPPKAARFFGFAEGGYVYVFRLPPHAKLMTQGGEIRDNREVGFPNKITVNNIHGVFKYHGTSKPPKEQSEPLPWKEV